MSTNLKMSSNLKMQRCNKNLYILVLLFTILMVLKNNNSKLSLIIKSWNSKFRNRNRLLFSNLLSLRAYSKKYSNKLTLVHRKRISKETKKEDDSFYLILFTLYLFSLLEIICENYLYTLLISTMLHFYDFSFTKIKLAS